MSNDEKKERLRKIVNKSARVLTDDDRMFLLAIGDELGLNRGGKSGCVKCWHDFAIQCWRAIVESEEQDGLKLAETDRKYILRKGVDLFFGSIRVNEATLTDELAEQIIARGFEKKYFAKCE